MRIIIDTTLERVIVPDSFFNQIDKMNAVLAEHGGTETRIEYTQYISDAFNKASQNAPIRKSDVAALRR